jgi:hypothetical protein
MTRLGKIARLPREIREQLNVRLSNGEVGRQLVEWLNGLPEVSVVLAAHFGGRPISEQNLTEWKQGGYEEWLRHQEDCSYARILTEDACELEKEAGGIRLGDRLAAPMALALGRLMREVTASPANVEQQRTLLGVARELALLRRSSNDAERVRLERERWETKQAELAEEKRKHHAQEAEKAWRKTHRTFTLSQLYAVPPSELQDCLEASARLRQPQSAPGEPPNRSLPGNTPG